MRTDPQAHLPEITLKAILLAILLTALLTAANIYLGLKVGMTVSASISASIISLGILSLFKRSNILESNIVQTAASAGESLGAGVIFTLPGLIIIHYWLNFNYWLTLCIAISGGILGVLFAVPLRRVLLADKTLRFPEGVAIGNVLKAKAEGGSLHFLLYGGLAGAIISLAQIGFRVLASTVGVWFSSFNTVIGFNLGFDAAVLGAGYIAGIRVGFSILIGALLGWFFGIPLVGWWRGISPTMPAHDVAMQLWSDHIRYIGVGTMFVGGIWTLLHLSKPIMIGFKDAIISLQQRRELGHAAIPRIERDIPIHYVGWGVMLLAILIFLLLYQFVITTPLAENTRFFVSLSVTSVVYLILFGFIFASVCGYLAGLVGSSSSPISAMVLAAILLISLFILGLLNWVFDPAKISASLTQAAIAFAIIVASLTAGAAAITNDTLQDLKAGQIIGATPWKQQVMLIVGVVVAACVIAPVLELLFNAYGIGGVMPRSGMDPNQMLAAPQASLMAIIAKGVMLHNLAWSMLGIGAMIGVVGIIFDEYLKTRGQRLPVLALGIGVYLPLAATTPLVLGSIVSYLVERHRHRRQQAISTDHAIILACGLVAGAAIMGVLLAIPTVLIGADALQLVGKQFVPYANLLSIFVILSLCYWLYYVGIQERLSTARK